MRLLTICLTTALCCMMAACSGTGLTRETLPDPQSPRDSAETTPDVSYTRYVVVLKDGTTDAQRDALAAGLSRRPTHFYSAVYKGFAGDLSAAEVAQIAGDPLVRMVEKDRECYILDAASNLPNPLLAAYPGSDLFLGGSVDYGIVKSTSAPQVTDWGVTRIQANLNTGRGNGVTVALIDTGCDLSHPDLFGAYIFAGGKVVNYNTIYPARTADDGQGHGSHCAGIVGARDNSFGSVGVAPDCKIIPIKVLSDTGSGAFSWMISGIDWAVAHAATYSIKVCSISLGGIGTYAPGELAVDNATAAGLTMCIAAGNNFLDANNFTPARATTAITVSALNSNDTFAGYSNWGTTIEVIAPGSGVFSTYRKGRYASLSGTSMACPHVAGCCALWLDNHPTDTRAQVLSALQSQGEAAPAPTWSGDPDGVGETLVKAQNL